MSIRLRLILTLTLATLAVWLSAVVWIEHSTRAQVERVLDTRLAEAARMVSSLLSDRRIALAETGEIFTSDAAPGYLRQLSCQIWSETGALVGQSSGAPDGPLTEARAEGYSTSVIEGEDWRVFTVLNAELGLSIMVGDSIAVRERLIFDVIGGLLLPAAVILPLLAMALWIGVSRGLRPLDRLTEALRQRSPQDLSPLPLAPAPPELRPVHQALDGLFARVRQARAHERDFTAFAAHELKTPLAGLKTQAQIARRAPDEATRQAALAEIEASVARSDRLVRQLLDLSALEAGEAAPQAVALGAILDEVQRDLAPLAAKQGVTLAVTGGEAARLLLPRVLLYTLLRNVAENAILASPAGSAVQLSARCAPGRCVIAVADQGPGIPEAIRARITERFFRGPGAPVGGSGLGLAIAAAAADRLGATLDFPAPGAEGGQVVRLVLPRPG
ncbi:ATP-binding protein [Pararhodobacter aggregans]|nr:ATP-binding protein [Pararhodobacter aggregans]PTX01665.1 two-component system sensor histidine kinase QseC [Pararhodobacter aggregans]